MGAGACALYSHDPAFRNLNGAAPLLTDRPASRLYLDHAATTPMLPAAIAAVEAGMRSWANPSSPHAEGRAARAALEAARARIAAAYGWGGETILTSGASEALAIALARAVAARRLISAVEHDAVIRAGGDAGVVPVDGQGLLDLTALAAMLDGERAIVGVQWCNSETGVRQPIAEIAAIVRAAGSLLLVDGAQMPASAAGDVVEHADFLAISAHKRGGPPGIGALLVRDIATLSPTGGQERGYRGGTENVPAALGFAAALAEAEDVAAMRSLRAKLDDAIARSGGQLVAADAPRHPAIGAYRMPGMAAATQLIRFDMAGIAVSAGSACSSGSMKPSHVLGAMGWSIEASREVLRVSFGRTTTEADVDRFIAEWRSVARSARAFAA
ncbi:cysteine desulfurase family protein [Sphingomonas sp. 10B4]|uniref:cysteine desulfurase family protein n=1 Tax=Sphingomonas sp. 10B4 TaxID=3048575 RepID=UPI002AB3E7DD|nr:aminotransferase class V-fold PLP-dependent enzyme [Sphingomonas sp. 10B4]MDY7522976.1 aminotransferase class V-fold PLP-dependent enzyme [Sphingomonas sp. 10B4]MEB0281311.1 aminotransferase class V-fold PLP-dependent enzyme [Sphingomonas sp. 10B4]